MVSVVVVVVVMMVVGVVVTVWPSPPAVVVASGAHRACGVAADKASTGTAGGGGHAPTAVRAAPRPACEDAVVIVRGVTVRQTCPGA